MQNNVTLGNKIAALRKSKGITQADLGTYLNISYQAVSKWERGESAPDFETLSKIAKYFNVPINYFESTTTAASTQVPTPTQQKNMLGVCKTCGKVVYEGNEGETSPALRCKACVEKERKEKQMKEASRRESDAKRLTWSFIVASIVAVAFLVTGIVLTATTEEGVTMLLGGLVLAVLSFTYVAQLFWDGWIVDCTLFGGRTLGTPGIIFEFDLDGFIFLIAMKILFAILRLLFWLLTSLLSILFAMIVSPFTFFPALHRVRTEGIE